MRTYIFSVIIITGVTSAALSTPNRATWENEILLGMNQSYFYTLKTCRYLTGTYFHSIDSVFLLEKDLKTGAVQEEIPIRVVEHRDETSMGDWTHTEQWKDPVNLIEYQMAKKMEILYQSNLPENYNFRFSGEGLMLHYKNREEQIVVTDHLANFISWIELYLYYQDNYKNDRDFRIRISEAYASAGHYFFVVESGVDHSDIDFKQSILVFRRELFQEAKRKIDKNIDP